MTRRRILVVDDEKNIRLMLKQVLANEETTVDTAVNGEEALGKLEGADYDVMLLDLRMPGMHGLEALQKIHALRPRLAIILLTAHGTVENAVEAMRGGAVNFLQKPFSPQEIRNVVDRALAERRIESVAGPTIMNAKRNDYIVIAGCGRLGGHLANQLSREGHSVVVIDLNEAKFQNLSAEFSGFRLEGDASELEVLKRSKTDRAQKVIAVTRDDNVNLAIAQIARVVFRVPTVVARVSDPAREAIFGELGIRTVSPVRLAADELLRHFAATGNAESAR